MSKLWLVGIIRKGEAPEISIAPHGRRANKMYRDFSKAMSKLSISHYTIEGDKGAAVVSEDACYFYCSVNGDEEQLPGGDED
jgi:hypothetical protein